MAQLHYTVLRHVGRVYDLLNEREPDHSLPSGLITDAGGSAAFVTPAISGTSTVPEHRSMPSPIIAGDPKDFDYDRFTEALVRLSAASDVADELLERRADPGHYPPWSEMHGKQARVSWRARWREREKKSDPLAPIRAYRNRLVHSRIVPVGVGAGETCYPRIEVVGDYIDWREPFKAADVQTGTDIVTDAWEEVLGYLDACWEAHLLNAED